MSRKPNHFAKRKEAATQPLQASALQRKLADAHRHRQAGRLDEAKQLCLQILEVDVRQSDCLNLLGELQIQTGHFQGAVNMLRRAIAVDGRKADYHSNLAFALRSQGNLAEAVAEYKQAVLLKPDLPEALSDLGGLLLNGGELADARTCLEKAVVLKPDHAPALHNLGLVLHKQGELEQAAVYLERALVVRPDHSGVLLNLGAVLCEQGELEKAKVCLERALALKPDYAEALLNLGAVFWLQGQVTNALVHYEQVLALKPDHAEVHTSRSMIQLLLGDFAAGWENYQWRYEKKETTRRSFSQPLWRGEPLNGARILLHPEQGLGDTLQFLRYLPMVRAAGGTVLLDVPSGLRRLAAELPGIAELTVSGEPLSPFDWHCPLMGLSFAFRTTLETISTQVPYLSIPEAARQAAATLCWPAEGLRVGLVWGGSPKHKNDWRRSIPLSLLAPLFETKGVHLFSLQLGPGAAQLAGVSAAIIDLAPAIGDMADTAALMAHLDLIITVDTAVAHLAGALARPVWVLLPFVPDWRWLLDREDSPWYPTMRLFRQSELGEWTPVIDRVRAELAALAAGHPEVIRSCRLPQADTALGPKPVLPAPNSIANLALIDDPRPIACKVCAGSSLLFGVVDFHKSCIEAKGHRLPLSGHPVYYRRCRQCAFTFTTAFDSWDSQSFHEHIYNDDYIEVDPDFTDARPSGNARLVASVFSASRDAIKILDFGGGEGRFAARLREQGFSAVTYDPFSSFDQMPAETFDLVTCFEVLEHVPFPRNTVTTMVSLLKDGGAILFSTLVQPANFAAVGLTWWYAGPRNGHVSLYSTQSLELLFKPHGMRVGSFNANLHIAYTNLPSFAAHLRIPG